MTTTNAREIRYDRETRDFAMYLDGVLVGFAATYFHAELRLDEIVYSRLQAAAAQVEASEAAELNALGEPMPASEAEALARHLVGELNEMEALGIVGQQLARYDAKSAQVRALGFEIGPDGRGGYELLPGTAVAEEAGHCEACGEELGAAAGEVYTDDDGDATVICAACAAAMEAGAEAHHERLVELGLAA